MQQKTQSAQPAQQQRRAVRQQQTRRKTTRRMRQGLAGLLGCATVAFAVWGGINYGVPLVNAAFAPARTFEKSVYDASGYVFDAEDPYLVLINRNVPSADFVPTLVQAQVDSEVLLDQAAAQAWQAMSAAALADGVQLQLVSGYQDETVQQNAFETWQAYYLENGWTETEAAARAATIAPAAGQGEHGTGLALDILAQNGTELDTGFAETEAYAWLRACAMEYGFILRYPEDRQAATGIVYEPWHWRYVGVENARAIVESGLTLEEFLALNQQNANA